MAGAAKVTKQMVNGKRVAFQSFTVNVLQTANAAAAGCMSARERIDNKGKNLK